MKAIPPTVFDLSHLILTQRCFMFYSLVFSLLLAYYHFAWTHSLILRHLPPKLHPFLLYVDHLWLYLIESCGLLNTSVFSPSAFMLQTSVLWLSWLHIHLDMLPRRAKNVGWLQYLPVNFTGTLLLYNKNMLVRAYFFSCCICHTYRLFSGRADYRKVFTEQDRHMHRSMCCIRKLPYRGTSRCSGFI